jgi:hypothetical protein
VKKKKEKIEEDDPDKPLFGGNDEGSEGAAESDESDVELPAYDLEDDESDLNPVKRVFYLRECINGLRNRDDYNVFEGSLRAVEGIIRSHPDDIGKLVLCYETQ